MSSRSVRSTGRSTEHDHHNYLSILVFDGNGPAHAERNCWQRKKKDANEGLLWLDALIHRNPHALTLNASRPNQSPSCMKPLKTHTRRERKRPGGTLPHVYFPGCFFSLPTYPNTFVFAQFQENLSPLTQPSSIGLGQAGDVRLLSLRLVFFYLSGAVEGWDLLVKIDERLHFWSDLFV